MQVAGPRVQISCSLPDMLINSAGPHNRQQRKPMAHTPRHSTESSSSSSPAVQAQVGRFLSSNVGPGDVFTREDLTAEQKLFGQTAAEFMRREVLPSAARLYARDWPFTRELLRKAGDLDLLRLEIPEAYGGLGLGKARAALAVEQSGLNTNAAPASSRQSGKAHATTPIT